MFNQDLRSHQSPTQDVFTVSTLNFAIRDQLEGRFFYCLVEGEVSNAAFPQSGHIYFNLKDDGAVIKAVIWRSQAALYRGLIANGQKVRLTGKISVYAPRGEYQLIASRVEEAGKGDLHLQFEALKRKLEAEGLFDPAHKKPIPQHPVTIGLVTSSTAAALQDVLNVFATHRPDITLQLYSTKVQGADAGKEIAQALADANDEGSCDLLLLVRGGGSIEDLWAFNEEVVARAIYQSRIPIITGVGHETDTTIADFVADLRAPTPSMAAKYSSQSKDELYQHLAEINERLENLLYRKIEGYKQALIARYHRLKMKGPKLQMQHYRAQLSELRSCMRERLHNKVTALQYQEKQLDQRLGAISLEKMLGQRQESVQQLSLRLQQAMTAKQKHLETAFVGSVEKLTLLSPLNTLLRGYSMTTFKEGAVVKSVSQVKKGDALIVKIADGELDVKVTTIR